MKWEHLLSPQRLGSEKKKIENRDYARSQFQRDYDRIIFSSPFRRMQNKTQVFPLPGSVFVHNRLTHSLEVASVGRTLGNILYLKLKHENDLKDVFLLSELGSIVSSACLAHDLGNPPFGHSGEKAISRYFNEGNGKRLKSEFSKEQWSDLIEFEGNANVLRLLSHQFKGRRPGGFALTYSTLASLVKYPYGSGSSQKKYGFFHSEKETFIKIANEIGLKRISENPVAYARHPLVYLVEAADDICYQVMDIEDAHKLQILSSRETHSLLSGFFEGDDVFASERNKVFETVTDVNEQVSYLRAKTINKLVNECIHIFIADYNNIMEGKRSKSLIDSLEGNSRRAMAACMNVAVNKIYNHSSVIEVELAGYNILGTLLEEFIPAVIHPSDHYSKKLISLLPEQFKFDGGGLYERIQGILDFISGMTDLYALDLYRKIKGIEIGKI